MSDKLKILVKFPTRERKKKFLDHLNNICDLATDPSNIHTLVTIDDDDDAMKFAKTASFDLPIGVTVISGKRVNKIEAVNRDIDFAFKNGYHIIFQTSDDMELIRKGWDEKIRQDMQEHFPDLDGCLHYPDGYKNEELITLTIMGINYLKLDGYLYNPIYKSVAADDELTAVAKLRGKYKYIPYTLFLHKHSFWLNTPMDNLLKYTQSQAPDDYVMLDRRKAENFGFPLQNA